MVVGEREVLVVDTCYLPSSADADIARLRGWTDKPVRWVVNTHWHNDHVGGNQRYRLTWPGAQVMAHDETRRMMDARVRSYVRRYVAPESAFARQRSVTRTVVASSYKHWRFAPTANALRAPLSSSHRSARLGSIDAPAVPQPPCSKGPR